MRTQSSQGGRQQEWIYVKEKTKRMKNVVRPNLTQQMIRKENNTKTVRSC